MSKDILILGGGYAGVLTAKHLAKDIRKRKLGGLRVTVIDKNPYHTMLTELHEVACGRVEESSIKMEFEKIFAGRPIQFVMDIITAIDIENNSLRSGNKSYPYDYLVVSPGSKPAYYGVQGAEENALSLWSFEDAVRMREHILEAFRQAQKETDPVKRKKLLSFFVVGCGFTGVEMAGELAEWVPSLCETYHIHREEVKLYIADMLDRVLTSFPPELSAKSQRRLKKMGVEVLLKTSVNHVDPDFIEIENANGDQRIETHTVIWTAGIEGAEVLQDSSMEKGKGKRLETNEYLQLKQKDNIYVAGDSMFFIPRGEKAPVPQMVENCEASSKCVAHNILAAMEGRPQQAYSPKFHGMMACIGGRYGVAHVGTHTKKFGLPSFLAMLSKHFINVVYFIQVLGWNKVYGYALHEIFRIRDNRSFLGGHFSNYSPNFWSVPLRLFLGFCWLREGLDKLPRILEDPGKIFLFNIPGADAVSSATQAAVDATSSASQAAAASAYGDALPVPGFITDVVNWFMQHLIAPVAPQFQAMMVLAEIALGLLILAGLFTAVASVASALLCVMIYSSGMAGESILWYLVAGISLIGIGGTGQVFALDYYVLPWLKEKWKKIKFVRKWYIYND